MDLARLVSTDAGQETAVPPIYCPIPPAVHPAVDLVDRRALDWMRCRGLCPDDQALAKLARINCGGLVARLFPTGTEHALETITKFCYWGFVLDDIVEALAHESLLTVTDRHLRLMRLLDAPHSTVLTDDPFAQAFREIRASIGELASPAVYRRWIELHRGFTLGVLWAAAYRQAETVPDPDAVTLIRPADAGASSYGIGLMEAAGDFEVPAEKLDRPDVRLLVDITSVILAWDNDIYSCFREAERPVQSINLVSALARHRDLDPRCALAEAIRMRNRAMYSYLRHRSRFPDDGDQPLHRYVRGLDHQIRGNLDWGLHATHRYLTTSNGSPALALCERPSRRIHGHDLTEPVDLPSIRWWWDRP
ncbi:hypothetical protein GCM10023321_79820 [Pseudonocardia eucalypti]|uniref:Terpene synthase n=1 Tax=Pseudonocardia eucalypti TaxID=648755 RepID=A0ABP9RC48_9PSEU|nr:hypothetical protein [Pseudonocardia eucalypti]